MKNNLKRTIIAFSAIYIAITIIFAVIVSTLLVNASKDSIEDTSMDLISADAHQIELNVNNYLGTVKSVCSLLFSDEAYYGYYDTNPELSDYDKIVAKDNILARIIDLAMMEDFCDFGIVYPNDKSAGWISQTTDAMFPNGGTYDYFSGLITDNISEEAWATGVMGNTDRIYFVKRLNPNAVAVLSFYTSEFNNVFTVPDELSSMTVRMVDSEGVIIYSTNKEEVYDNLPGSISTMIGNQTGISAFNEEYMVTANVLTNGWRVVCSISTDTLMHEQIRIANYITLIVIVIVVAVILIELLIINRLSSSVKDVVINLEDKAATDLMTGLLNKTSFRLQIEEDLKTAARKKSKVFFIMDLDNFKLVNDELGHKSGDEVIIKMGDILRDIFSEGSSKIGRIGGDEFAAYCSFEDMTPDMAEEWAKEKVSKLYKDFARAFAVKMKKQNLSISIGILVEGSEEHGFDYIYKKTDDALYESKRNGKGKPTYIKG